jgi:hypothetical protein
MTITGGNIGQTAGKGTSIIIRAAGKVTISGDITYNGPGGSDTFASFDQIPQVVIIANDISILNSATHIDAWLETQAGGTINTCGDVGPEVSLTLLTCPDQLVINGQVGTSHLYLRRTAGADNADLAGDPAEIINLPAQTYAWAQRWASESGKAQTVYTRQLPPRF